MAQGKLAEATKLLPSSFREVYTQPKIREQITAIGSAPVKAMVEFQLARLASLMTTGGNLNDPMTDFIAGQLIEMFPTESIADLKLCFERGAMGRYGQIQRMDGVTIGEWMGCYLDEKYAELENQIHKRRSNEASKEPVETLKPIYEAMADETTKHYMAREFERREMARKFGTTPMPFICDGVEIYAKSYDEAVKSYREAFGNEPQTVSKKEIENQR